MADDLLVLMTIKSITDEETNAIASPHEIAQRARLDVGTVERIVAVLERRGAVMAGPPAYFVDAAPQPPRTYVVTARGRAELET